MMTATTARSQTTAAVRPPSVTNDRSTVTVPARVDLYAGIHKGLRAWMTDVLGQAGRVDPSDPADITALGMSLRALLEVCRSHLQHENNFVHAAMERAIPGSAARIATEHVTHERAIALIEQELDGLEKAAIHARAAAANRLYRHLALFIAENFEHMNVEETEHNAVLWSAFTDADLMEIEGAIIASHSPEAIAATLRWMVPAMSAPERAALFTGMRAGAPAEVVNALLDAVRPYLSQRDWSKLMAALGPMN